MDRKTLAALEDLLDFVDIVTLAGNWDADDEHRYSPRENGSVVRHWLQKTINPDDSIAMDEVGFAPR